MCSPRTVYKIGFRHAARGIAVCIGRERNFRIHLTAAGYSAALGLWMRFDRIHWAALFLTQALVLALELVNTAVEAAVDLSCPEYHPVAGLAKDAAAGAVLVAAAFSVGIGFCLFWTPKLFDLAVYLLTSPWAFLTAAASGVLSALFIFGHGAKNVKQAHGQTPCAPEEKRKTNEF